MLHNEHVRGLKPGRIECDEVWSFIHRKAKRVATAKAAPEDAGDCWTWTAIDPETKLMLTWHVGLRTRFDATEFILDLADRVTNFAQLTTDGFADYPEAVYTAFGDDINFAQLVKIYESESPTEARYNLASCVGSKKIPVWGRPDRAKVSTSIVERSNLTVRMSMQRFTRSTNGHSKKIENHGHMVSLFLTYYNFCRNHSSIRVTPAMAAGLTDRVWEIENLIQLLD